MKKIIFIIITAVLLSAASTTDTWQTYWYQPTAKSASVPHDWSDLERNMSSLACAQCHEAQFSAWSQSLHAKAYSPGLVGQFPHLGLDESSDCLSCHAPLQGQGLRHDSLPVSALVSLLKEDDKQISDDSNEDVMRPLAHEGVTCAACHVRGWQRFGPPRLDGKLGMMDGPAHGGFTALADFGKSQFCASCHQFPQEYAVNGKPLENTVEEWKQSRFAREGTQCQSCHMPNRQHQFKGIHDPDMVRKGLHFQPELIGKSMAKLTLTSTWIGHAFPTYVTPKVVVSISTHSASGKVLQQQSWEISRKIAFDNGWQEQSDTRLLPGESRMFIMSEMDATATSAHFKVEVWPDHFYSGLYAELLEDEMLPAAEKLIKKAAHTASERHYVLFEQQLPL